MHQRICLVDTCFRLEGVPRVALLSESTIADYDMVIIDWRQCFRGWMEHDAKLDRPVIPTVRTRQYWNLIRGRNEHLNALADRGSTVVCILSPVENHLDANHGKVSSLDWLPRKLYQPSQIVPASRCRLQLVDGTSFDDFLVEYRNKFSCYALFSKPEGHPLILDGDSDGVAALTAPFGKGYIVFIPGFLPEIEEGLSSSVYTQYERDFISVFADALVTASAGLRIKGHRTAPEWVDKMTLPADVGILDAIRRKEDEIHSIEGEIEVLRSKLGESRDWRKLLYEKDAGVTEVAKKSLELLGFEEAQPRADGLTVDGFFRAPEGYLLIKVEGTDNSPIAKETLLDLFHQTAEELARRDEDVSSVLIGNAFRLAPPEQREEQFSKPVQKIAGSHNLGLMTSKELFKAIGYALGHPDDNEFKAQCRKTLLDRRGQEITFKIPEP